MQTQVRQELMEQSRGTTVRQSVQQQSELDRGEGGSESGTNNHCDESIVEHSVATQDIET